MQNQDQDISTISVPTYIKYLDSIVDKLFISSFILNKIKDFPIPYVSIIATNIALLCIAIAFTIQIATTHYYHTQTNQEIFNFTLRSHLFANIGAFSAWMCVFFPQLWLISLWIFCVNNLLWAYNEISRLTTPSIYPKMPQDPKEYCKYVACIAIATFVSAIANTLGLMFIDQTQMILLTGTILNWVCSAFAVHALFKSNEKTEPKLQDLPPDFAIASYPN